MNENDMISREAAIDTLKGLEFCHYMEFGEYIGEDTREVRLIRAEKAQDALRNLPSVQRDTDEWCHDCSEYDHDRHCCPRWNRVIRETLKDAQQWIPCSERPPEDDNVYFVTVHPDYVVPGGLSVDTLHWYDGKWWFDYYGQPAEFTDPIIAWMPLPEPYGGEQE